MHATTNGSIMKYRVTSDSLKHHHAMYCLETLADMCTCASRECSPRIWSGSLWLPVTGTHGAELRPHAARRSSTCKQDTAAATSMGDVQQYAAMRMVRTRAFDQNSIARL